MLSGLTCSVLVARLLADVSVTLAVIVGLLALLGTALLGWIALTRFRHNEAALRRGGPVSDGRANLALSAVVAMTAVGAGAYVVLG